MPFARNRAKNMPRSAANDAAGQVRGMVLEGSEALDLYVKEIGAKMTEITKQTDLLSEECESARRTLGGLDLNKANNKG